MHYCRTHVGNADIGRSYTRKQAHQACRTDLTITCFSCFSCLISRWTTGMRDAFQIPPDIQSKGTDVIYTLSLRRPSTSTVQIGTRPARLPILQEPLTSVVYRTCSTLESIDFSITHFLAPAVISPLLDNRSSTDYASHDGEDPMALSGHRHHQPEHSGAWLRELRASRARCHTYQECPTNATRVPQCDIRPTRPSAVGTAQLSAYH